MRFSSPASSHEQITGQRSLFVTTPSRSGRPTGYCNAKAAQPQSLRRSCPEQQSITPSRMPPRRFATRSRTGRTTVRGSRSAGLSRPRLHDQRSPTLRLPRGRRRHPRVASGKSLPGFPFWPSWSVYDSRLPAAMQRFSHCCQVRYSFRCRSGLRMLADHGVPAKPEGPLATPLPRRPSVTRVRWLFRAVDVTLRAQVAPKFAAACRRTTSGSDAPPQAATNNIARASRAVRPSSSADAASSSATSF